MASARGPHGRSDCPKNPMKREPVGIVVELGSISASEAETIWMSRIAMNMPTAMAMKAKTRRLGMISV